METQPTLYIQTEAGIGDFSWVYSKLVNLNLPLHITLPDAEPKRGHQLLDLLPAVKSWDYKIPQKIAGRFMPCVFGGEAFKDLTTSEFLDFAKNHDYKIWFSLNNYLEKNQRLEHYIRDLPTSFHYEIISRPETKSKTDELLQDKKNYLLLYTSSYKSNARWDGWSDIEWAEFVKSYQDKFGDCDVVIIGAEWDIDMGSKVAAAVPNALNLVGKTDLDVALEIINRSNYFVAFPSGLAILSTVLNKPVFMFYPKDLKGLRYSWAPQDMISCGGYQPSFWCDPSEVIEWLVENKPRFAHLIR